MKVKWGLGGGVKPQSHKLILLVILVMICQVYLNVYLYTDED